MKLFKNKNIYLRIILSGLLILLCVSLSRTQSIAPPDGYAAYEGTTGGGSAMPVFVSTASAFESVAGNNNPAVIIVDGMLNVGEFNIGSNKTIVGANSSSGLYGGTIKLRGSNYILQNLTFGPASGDVMEASGATKIFVTKCSFHDASDELFSIVRESDYVTVSWCKFYFDHTHSHAFAHLIGNDDDRITDRGKLHVTMHHNWYAEGIRSRMPRVRFGHVHIYNNYYNSVGNNYCIGVGVECHNRVENCHFENVSDIWNDMGGADNGEMGWNNLKLENCSLPTFIANSYPVFDLPYTYSLDSVDSVKTIVQAGAGNVFGDDYYNFPNISITSPSNDSVFNADSNITIIADASVTDGEIAFVKFFSNTLLGVDSTAPYTFTWESVDSGLYKIYALASDTNGAVTFSDKVTLLVGSGVTITSPYNNEKFIIPTDININVSAWDSDGSISGVEFFEDTTSLGTDDSLPYTFTWNDVQPGTYVLTAKATDNNSNIFNSNEVTINVVGGPAGYEFCSTEGSTCYFEGVANVAYGADGHFNYKMYITDSIVCSEEVFGDPIEGVNKSCYVQEVSPYVSITSPDNYTIFTAPDSITFTVNAIDNDGKIDSVQYMNSDNVIGTSKVAPFSFIWSNVPGGNHSISAKAFDNDGNTFTSKIILITVKGVSEIADPVVKDISLYPNPVFDELVLNIGNNYSDNITLSLYNSLGKKVMEETLSGGSHILNLNALPGGVYFILLSGEAGNIVRKITKY